MDWNLYLQQIQESIVSRPEDPPSILLFVGLFIFATAGFAFLATLRLNVSAWHRTRISETAQRWEKLQLLIPFLGAIAGFWLFLGASLQVLGIAPLLAWLIALFLSVLAGAISWSLIGRKIGQGMVRTYLDDAFHLS